MAEIRTVTTLRRKRDDISASIRLYECQLAQARADLASITAAIKIFEASGDPAHMTRYVETHRLFRYGETWTICKAALERHGGPMMTRELTAAVMKAKGLDTGDRVLAQGISHGLVHALIKRRKRSQLRSRLRASADLPLTSLQKIAIAARYMRSGSLCEANKVPDVTLKSFLQARQRKREALFGRRQS